MLLKHDYLQSVILSVIVTLEELFFHNCIQLHDFLFCFCFFFLYAYSSLRFEHSRKREKDIHGIVYMHQCRQASIT